MRRKKMTAKGMAVTIDTNVLEDIMDDFGFHTIIGFSEATGISRGTLSELLSGKRDRVRVGTLRRIETNIGCDIGDLCLSPYQLDLPNV
jgi:hypothetical protein